MYSVTRIQRYFIIA